MSRKTVHWRKIAVQCGHRAESVMPRRTQGTGAFRADELDEWQREHANKVVCCRPMKEAKAARYVAAIGIDGEKPRGFKPL